MNKQQLNMFVNLQIAALSRGDIIRQCPEAYGSVVTEDHINYLYNALYDEAKRLSDHEIGMYVAALVNALVKQKIEGAAL